jgi:hypothetical protein
MSRYKAYPEYKDSGVEWLNPKWEKRLVHFLRARES